jgi:DNA polymerase-1
MRQAYLNGEDLHTLTASLITGKPIEAIASEDRRMAKAINFGLIYGMGPSKLKVYAETEYGVTMTLKQATLFRRRFFTAYSDLKEWHSEIKSTVYATNKREIRTLAGRRRRWSTNPPLSELYNHPVQGSCADFLKVALGKLHAALDGTDAELIGTVHDEIILECPSERVDLVSRILQECMLSPAATALQPIPVEVEIKVGNSWGD